MNMRRVTTSAPAILSCIACSHGEPIVAAISHFNEPAGLDMLFGGRVTQSLNAVRPFGPRASSGLNEFRRRALRPETRDAFAGCSLLQTFADFLLLGFEILVGNRGCALKGFLRAARLPSRAVSLRLPAGSFQQFTTLSVPRLRSEPGRFIAAAVTNSACPLDA